MNKLPIRQTVPYGGHNLPFVGRRRDKKGKITDCYKGKILVDSVEEPGKKEEVLVSKYLSPSLETQIGRKNHTRLYLYVSIVALATLLRL